MVKNEASISKKITRIEESILNTNNMLEVMMEYQTSLEILFKEIIKENTQPIIAVKGAKKIDFIPIHEIVYCIANLSYTEVVAENHTKILASKPINDYESFLSNHSFYRISKSLLINIKQIHSYDRQNNRVIMKNKEILDVARRRKSDFLATILPE